MGLIKKAIRHFQCMRDDAQVVLDSGFGTHPGESDLVYRNRKIYAELAIQSLSKQLEMLEYCDEVGCAKCQYHKDDKCMNEFIIDVKAVVDSVSNKELLKETEEKTKASL